MVGMRFGPESDRDLDGSFSKNAAQLCVARTEIELSGVFEILGENESLKHSVPLFGAWILLFCLNEWDTVDLPLMLDNGFISV